MGYYATTRGDDRARTPETPYPLLEKEVSGHRYHMPEIGRWLNRDPAEEEGGRNNFSFIGNHPSDVVDYLGMLPMRWVHVYAGNPAKEVTSEDQIPITYTDSPGGGFQGLLAIAWGLEEPEDKPAYQRLCVAQIDVSITLSKNAPKTWTDVPKTAVKFGYFQHAKSQDGKGLLGGYDVSGRVVDNSIPVPVLEAHERAHAKVFFEYVNSAIASLDQLYGKLPLGVSVQQFVWGFLSTEIYQKASAKAANTATVDAFSALTMEFPSTGNASGKDTTPLGSTPYHYVWKK